MIKGKSEGMLTSTAGTALTLMHWHIVDSLTQRAHWDLMFQKQGVTRSLVTSSTYLNPAWPVSTPSWPLTILTWARVYISASNVAIALWRWRPLTITIFAISMTSTAVTLSCCPVAANSCFSSFAAVSDFFKCSTFGKHVVYLLAVST